MNRHVVPMTLALISLILWTSHAESQTASTISGYAPRSYADYHHQQVGSYRTLVNPRRYTVDRYFYHSRSLSPYLNLARRTGPSVNKYYHYVKPELDRRATATQPSQLLRRRSSFGTGAATQWQGNHWTLRTR